MDSDNNDKLKEASEQLNKITPKLDKKEGVFTPVGYMVSEARAKAWAYLSECAKNVLTHKIESEEFSDAIEDLHEAYVALMEIVKQESRVG